MTKVMGVDDRRPLRWPGRDRRTGSNAMSSDRPSAHAPRIDWAPVVIGGVLVALGDFIFATTLWFSWDAEGLRRVFQTIAVGVLGQPSYQGGMQSAVLGAALHVLMATAFVAIYTLVARRYPSLLARPV